MLSYWQERLGFSTESKRPLAPRASVGFVLVLSLEISVCFWSYWQLNDNGDGMVESYPRNRECFIDGEPLMSQKCFLFRNQGWHHSVMSTFSSSKRGTMFESALLIWPVLPASCFSVCYRLSCHRWGAGASGQAVKLAMLVVYPCAFSCFFLPLDNTS